VGKGSVYEAYPVAQGPGVGSEFGQACVEEGHLLGGPGAGGQALAGRGERPQVAVGAANRAQRGRSGRRCGWIEHDMR
jgi:hypothetical protein